MSPFTLATISSTTPISAAIDTLDAARTRVTNFIFFIVEHWCKPRTKVLTLRMSGVGVGKSSGGATAVNPVHGQAPCGCLARAVVLGRWRSALGGGGFERNIGGNAIGFFWRIPSRQPSPWPP